MTADCTLMILPRFCRDELNEDPGIVLANLGPAEIKTFFDWIEKNFKGSIKADLAFSNYWRVLKGLYYDKTWKVLDEHVLRDCLNVSSVSFGFGFFR